MPTILSTPGSTAKEKPSWSSMGMCQKMDTICRQARCTGPKPRFFRARRREELSSINLGFTRITAPFDGRLSHSLVFPGTLISAGTNINTRVQIRPIYATFSPPRRRHPHG